MKVAVASIGNTLDSNVSPFFGRCPYFLIAELEGEKIGSFTALPNSAMNQRGGAGISAAQLIGNQQAQAVIAGAIGPQAFSVLQQLGIELFTAVPGTVRLNMQKLAAGELQKMVSSMAPIGPMGVGRGPMGGRGGYGPRGRGPPG